MNAITSRKNPLIAHLKRLGSDPDYRREKGEFLCDGEKLLADAVASGAEVVTILTEREELPFKIPRASVYHVTRSVMEAASPLKTPQDILFTCKMPRLQETEADFAVLLDGVQDPGNLGTILRTAAAFGVPLVLLTGGCADPYNPKTVRATTGAVFRQPVRRVTLEELRDMKARGVPLYGAALEAGSADIRDLRLERGVLAIGSEGRGLSREVLDLCDRTVIIPMRPGTESLNAATAAAILMWEARRDRL